MSEKLTVAELLARNGRGGSSDDSRPRRRHRNLTDGGLSVAELTGAIPVVKDEHVKAAAEAAANGGMPLKSTKSRHSADLQAAAAEAEAQQAETPVQQAERKKPEAAKPGIIDAELVEEPETPEAPTAERKAAAATAGAGAATAAGAAFVASKNAEEKNAAGTKAADVKAASTKADSAKADAAKVKPENTPDKTSTSTSPAKNKNAGERAGSASGDVERPKEFEELEATLKDGEVVDYEDNRISWPAMAAQAVGAVVVGVVLFVVFNLLWNSVSPIIVLVLSLIVTAALVLGVHILLRHKDKLLMLLAFIVGLVLTIGPRLILGL